MYSLLLVDDEQVILDGLFGNVDWEESGFANVHRAGSAREALDLMNRFRIDVLVTDISMPDMDGLMLCEAVRANWPLCRVVFLSGFQSFEYARRAVEMGVYQYLVKPVRYEDLQQTVEGALSELQAELSQRHLLNEARARMASMDEMMRTRCAYSWIVAGELSPDADSDEMAQVGLALTASAHGFLVLVDVGGGADEPALIVGLQTLAARIFEGYDQICAVPARRRQLIIALLSADVQQAQSLYARCRNRLDAFQIAAQKSLGRLVSICMGVALPASRLHDSFVALRTAMDRDRLLDEGQILIVEDHETERVMPNPGEALAVAAAAMDQDALLAWIQRATDRMRRADAQGRELGRLIVTELIGALMCDAIGRGLSVSELERVAADLFSPAAMNANADALKGICARAAHGYLSLLRERRLSQRARTVEGVRGLIAAQMGVGLSVNDVAAALHYNPSYLSQLVKQETGQSLGDLMLSMRMEVACRLLVAGERVQDVAVAVGYDNLAHFSRTFKKRIGVSPRQYA